MEEDVIEKIKNRVNGRSTIHISRIPPQTKSEFMKLAEKEFENDFGFTLKWLLDFRNGLLSVPSQAIFDRIDILAEQVGSLQEQLFSLLNKPEEKVKRKMLSGRIIGKGGKK